ncbi:hypothetical protein CLOM_g14310 [Closterium sp. NIES-68]|nr:hypothetical protein CLOM_g14310 [Closterium sp. NIES-68]GJP61706.1 hypothetical protein CLOP_g18850 [Closterium sp. NIES-67]
MERGRGTSLVLALVLLLSTIAHASAQTFPSRSLGPDRNRRLGGTKISHARRLLAEQVSADASQTAADMDDIGAADVSSAENASKDGAETKQPEPSENGVTWTLEDFLISDDSSDGDESSSKDDEIFYEDSSSSDLSTTAESEATLAPEISVDSSEESSSVISTPAESEETTATDESVDSSSSESDTAQSSSSSSEASPAAGNSVDDDGASTKEADGEPAREEEEQPLAGKGLIKDDLAYGPEIQAFDDVTTDDGVEEAEEAEAEAEAESEEEAEGEEEEVELDEDVGEMYQVAGGGEGGSTASVAGQVGAEVTSTDGGHEAESGAEGAARAEVAGETGAEWTSLDVGASAEQAEGGESEKPAADGRVAAETAKNDLNKGPELQVFDDVNEAAATNADGAEKATVAEGNNDGSSGKEEGGSEEGKAASSEIDNKDGGIDEGLKELIALDAGLTGNPISMVLDGDIEPANKGVEEALEVEGEGKEEGDEKEGHRRVLWMLDNSMELIDA